MQASIGTRSQLAAPVSPVAANDPRYRFLARFGATILSGGVAAIPMALYHYQANLGLTPQEVWFVGYILAHRWTADLPYPSLRRMSRHAGVSTQMLHRYKQSLIEKGYLVTIPRHRPSGGRTSNYYDFSGLFQALEELLIRDRRDPSWRPTVDETADVEASEFEPIGTFDQLSQHNPETAEEKDGSMEPGPSVLPASQQPDSLTWADAIAIASQRALTDPSPIEVTAPQQPALTDAGLVRGTASGDESHPQEQSRSIRSRKRVASTAEQDAAPTEHENETTKRYLHNTFSPEERWDVARATVANEVSPAVYRSWIEPLRLVVDDPAGASGGGTRTVEAGSSKPGELPIETPVLVLACSSAFHLQQMERRYRSLVERAVGSSVRFIQG